MVATIKLTDESAPYLWRINKAKDRVLQTKPSVDLENARILTESFMKTEGEPYVVRKSKAFREQCERKTIPIYDDELIVGGPGSRIRAGLLCPDACWSILDNEIDTISTRCQDPFTVTEDDKRVLEETIKPFWQGKSVYEKWQVRIPEDIRRLRDASVIYVDRKAVRGPGELTADYEWVIKSGINGIRDRIEKKLVSLDPATPEGYEKITYLNALLIVCDGIVTLAKRYARSAEKMAQQEKNPRRRAELENIAQICDWVPANPARTFWEALQSMYFYHICILMDQNGASYNPGRMDQYLYPLYEKGINEGEFIQDEAQELLDCLWVKFSETCLFQDEENAKVAAGYNMFQNVCSGGINESGQDAVNELSYMLIQATMDVRLYQPSLSVRYNPGKNPDAFLRKIVDLISLGTGFPAFHNDEVGIKMMMDKGVTLKEAYNWNPCGCVETNLMGKLRGITGLSDVNLGSAFELSLLNGEQRISKSCLGLQTGDPRNFETFDDFKSAVKTQIAYLIKKVVESNHVLETITYEQKPVPVPSLTFKDCIENGKDYEWGGAKYNTGNGILIDGVADLINSLAAINHLVYEDQKVTWDDLLRALDDDFEGYEEIRRLCLSAPKYGNDIQAVDEVATEMFQFIADEVSKYRGRHGRMNCGILPVTAHIPCGKVVGALPSGRKAWTPLTDGLSPTGGTDITGPTAILKSVSKIPHPMYTQGTLLNMKLDPSVLADDRGKRNLMNFLKSLCDLGVYHIQFNVISAETLRKAQKEPENHRNLLIRVAGYTAFFVELDKEIQDEIIGRTVQAADMA